MPRGGRPSRRLRAFSRAFRSDHPILPNALVRKKVVLQSRRHRDLQNQRRAEAGEALLRLCSLLIDLFMRPDRLQQNRLRAIVLHKLKDDPQIVAGAARLCALQSSFQFVGAQAWIESILSQER